MQNRGLIIGIALTLMLSGTMIAQTGVAPSGSGTSGDPYLIATWQNLYWISQNSGSWSSYFKQTTDIDLSSASPAITTWDSNQGWTPIGSSPYFTGSYDGQNYTINGLYINRNSSSANEQGLFGPVYNATIANLGLTNVDITAVGEYYYDEMFDEWDWDGGSYIGALAGWVYSSGANTTITNCYSHGTVYGRNIVGGLVGQNWTSSNTCLITECYTTVDVFGQTSIGGFVGTNHGTITNCYSRGDVTRLDESSETSSIAVFIGFLYSGITTKCYTTGNVYYENTTAPTTKGFIGYTYGSISYSNNFWDSEASNQSSATGATSKTTTQMQTQSTFTDAGWDFTDTWTIIANYNDSYPCLQWALEVDQSLPVELTDFGVECRSDGVLVSWRTESESENLGFILERRDSKLETGNWKQIASYLTDSGLEGHGSTPEKHDYQYTDNAVQPGMTYEYRLGDVDYSGIVTWHNAKEITIETSDTQVVQSFGLLKAYPNPFNPSVTLSYSIKDADQTTLNVYNMRGQLVETLVNSVQQSGSYNIAWQPQNLSTGVYIVRLQSGNQTNLQKVVFVK